MQRIKKFHFIVPQTTSYMYDERGRIEQSKTERVAQQFDYQYDDNVTQIDSGSGAEVLDFAYDDLDRLTGVSNGFTADYEYDEVGNLTLQGEPGVLADPLADAYQEYFPRRPHAVGLVYDDVQRDPADIVRSYHYDPAGNVIAITEGADALLVDSDGDRTSKNGRVAALRARTAEELSARSGLERIRRCIHDA